MPQEARLDLKPSREAYPRWLRRKFRIDAVAKGRAYYETVAGQLRDQVSASPFWTSLQSDLSSIQDEYRIATAFDLTVGSFPGVISKGWPRFLDKTYRKNVQDNENWPNPPEDGWMLPVEWFSRVKDVVRTMFVVKYMDGVHFLGARIEASAEALGLAHRSTLQSTQLGYYAGHVTVQMPLKIPLTNWSVEVREVTFEIQITTQAQELIRNLLHPHYERAQEQSESSETPWQWDYDGSPFAANYLGHILHYLEGQIMKVREQDR